MKVYFRRRPLSHDKSLIVVFLITLAAAVAALCLAGCGELTRNGVPEPIYPAFKFLAGPFL